VTARQHSLRSTTRLLWHSLIVACCCAATFPGALAATLQITELHDINLGEVPVGTDRLRQRMRFCVSMAPAGPFQITAFGTQHAGQFVLTNGLGVEQGIGFELFVSRRARARGRPLIPGVPMSGLNARAPRRDGSCRPPLVQMRLVVDRQDLRTAASGRYSAQIQLTVAPE